MICIPADLLARIEAAARRARPREACGLLVGRKDRIASVIETANRARRADRFLIDPARHLALQRELRGSSGHIIGHFHTHPKGPAEPSAADHAGLGEPGRIWLITAIGAVRCETRAFVEESSGFRETRLLVLDLPSID